MRADEPCVHERELTFPLGRFFFLTGLPCAECAAEEHAAWVESVRVRLVAAVEAIGRGEPVVWDTWPRVEQPAEPEDAWEPPQYEGLEVSLRGDYTTTPGDVWQNVLDLYADMDRYRKQHGPFLRELRCTAVVRPYLVALIGRGEAKPWELPPLTRVPLIDDADIPAGAVRFVYDDGTTRDVQVIAAVQCEADTDWAFEIPFPAPGGTP